MQALISIIVPVHNAQSTLHKCIESILNQKYSNIELLLIDDGSTDNSLLICKEFAQKDFRIKVYHQNNQGVSVARNWGIEKCIGEWISFIDSDDYIAPTYLNKLVTQAEGCELIIGGNNRIKANNLLERAEFPDSKISIKDNDIACIMDNVLIYGTPWGKLFQSSTIKDNNIRFKPEFQLHEDHIFYFEVINHLSSIRLITDSDYYYVDNGQETLSRKKNIPSHLKWDAYLTLSHQLKQIIIRWNLDVQSLVQTKNFIIRLHITAIIISYHKESNDTRRFLLAQIDKNKISVDYKPSSKQGKIIKFILVYLPQFIQHQIFKLTII